MNEWKQLLVDFNKKYAKEIAAVATANNMDLAVGSEMFRYNLRNISVIPGFYKGITDLDLMLADFMELEAARRK